MRFLRPDYGWWLLGALAVLLVIQWQRRRLYAASTTVGSIDDVYAYVEDAEKSRHDMAYQTDGVVIKIDSLEEQGRLGYTSKAPR